MKHFLYRPNLLDLHSGYGFISHCETMLLLFRPFLNRKRFITFLPTYPYAQITRSVHNALDVPSD